MHFDLEELIKAIGYVGIFVVVFIESGLLVGMFLPGDSLLFTAGFLASQDYLNIALLMIVVFVAAVTGDNFGYTLGKRYGPRIFKKEKSIFFDKDHLKRSEDFYKKHGGKTIILARFTPIVRSFAPLLAGVGKMPHRTFFLYNIVGGFIWSVGLTLLGYFLGSVIPNIDKYLLPIIGLIILLSLSPSIIHLIRHPHELKKILVNTKAWFSSKRTKN